MQSSQQIVNIIFYGENQADAADMAKNITLGTENENVWVGNQNNLVVNGYVRWPGCVPNASPAGVCDVLVAHVTCQEGEGFNVFKKYYETRKGIPTKLLTGCEEAAKKLNLEYVAWDAFNSEATRNQIVNAAQVLDNSLKAAFNKIDSNNNGTLEAAEIIKVSAELGHTITMSEAQDIIASLSKEGKLNFDEFKKWWVMGKTDFASFRKLVLAEGTVKKILASCTSQFKACFDSLQNEPVDPAEKLETHIHIGPQAQFDTGISLNLHLNSGKNFDSLIANCPSFYQNGPVFGIELELKDASQGAKAIETFNNVFDMVSELPGVGEVLNFVEVTPRQIGSIILIEVAISEVMVGMIQAQFSFLNEFKNTPYTGSGNCHLMSGLTVTALVEQGFEQLIDLASKLRLEGNAEHHHLKILLSLVPEIVKNLLPEKKAKKIKYLVNFLKILRKINFNFEYDNNQVTENIKTVLNKDTENNEGFEEKKAMFEAMREQGLMMAEQMKEMVQMFVGPYMETIGNLNLDKLSVFASLSLPRVHLKKTIALPGLTSFLNEKIFN